jgi:hypothetical protein
MSKCRRCGVLGGTRIQLAPHPSPEKVERAVADQFAEVALIGIRVGHFLH